uniref:Uncharacterized protein n=1 Tax=Rhizophora mucronata TaxID=61149 RepID=A0A2P2PPX9_RHIMU
MPGHNIVASFAMLIPLSKCLDSHHSKLLVNLLVGNAIFVSILLQDFSLNSCHWKDRRMLCHVINYEICHYFLIEQH